MHGTGVVAVTVSEGPMSFASHAVRFVAIGTVVRPLASGHTKLAPMTAVSLNDRVVAFDAQTLG